MYDKFISTDRKRYLRRIRMNKIAIIITQISIVAFFIILWEVLANLKIIDSFITSQPSRILDTFIHLSSNDLLKHLGVTFYETIVRFYLWYITWNLYCNCLMAFQIFVKGLRTFSSYIKQFTKSCSWSDNYNMGRCRYSIYNCYGSCNFINSYNT